MKILVIGGTRFIGLEVTLALHRMGHEVAVFNRGQTLPDLPEGIQQIEGDHHQMLDHADALRAYAPEIVLHNIVLHDDHVKMSHEIFTGIARKFVMTSSMDVYLPFGRVNGTEPGDLIPGIMDEDSPVRNKWYIYRTPEMPEDHRMYRYDKIPAETATLHYPAMAGVVLRLPMVIGPRDWQRRLLGFMQPMKDGRKYIVLDEVYANWHSTYGYVENVAHAMALATIDDRANGRIYNVADTILPTLALANKVKDAMQWDGEFVLVPPDELPEKMRFGVAQPQDLMVAAERIKKELEYAPIVNFDEGIKRALAWEIDNPPDPFPEDLRDYTTQDEVLKTLGKI